MKERKAVVVSVINNKGGVGKTMTAQNLSAALALKGKRVCMIDFDSQHNLTNRFENSEREGALQTHDYTNIAIEDYMLNEELGIKPVSVKENLFLIPSTIKLSEVSAKLYGMKKDSNAGEKLHEICDCMETLFDYIVVDSEPGMSALMVNATRAAHIILIPVNCQDALNGAGEGVFGLMDANGIDVPYYFLQTMYEERLKSCRDIKKHLLDDAFENTLRTQIKRNEYLNSAGNAGMDIFEYAPKSQGANDYECLALELIGIVKKM
jgi:chromosome partitioning protein